MSELATVKKGTPLYGQPSWWGEGEDNKDDNSAVTPARPEGEQKHAGKNSRPSSLVLSPEEGATSGTRTMSAGQAQRRPSATYMEIPLRDDSSPEGDDSKGTPAKSISSSLSKDSLYSPEVRQTLSAKGSKKVSPSVDFNPATSFTVELDDHPPRKININASLSEFVPSKIRKGFRERKDRAASSKTSSKESTPSKNSEERELSPGHCKKIEEIWSAVESKGKSSRLATVSSSSSLRSPNLEDIDRLSELSEERKSLEREMEKKGRKAASSKSPLTLRQTKVKLPSSSSASSPSTGSLPSVSLSQYSDPRSYLIDKMFEGDGSTPNVMTELSPDQNLSRSSAVSGHGKTASSRMPAEKFTPKPSSSQCAKNVSSEKSSKLICDHEEKNGVASEDSDLQITENVVVVTEEKEDQVSEAGTYTIDTEVNEGHEEEEEARKRIDQVFGVEVDKFTSADWPIISSNRQDSPGGYDNVCDEDIDGDKTPLDENYPYSLRDDVVDDGNDDDDDDDDDDDTNDGVDDDEEEQESSDMTTTDGVQTWVSQLTALTSQKSAGLSSDGTKSLRDPGDASLFKKPPQGLSRKRPGTGRKLPSIPTDRSPVSSEHSSYLGEHPDLSFNDDLVSPSSRASDIHVNGRNNSTASAITPTTALSGKSARTSSSHPGARGARNGFPDSQGGSPAHSTRSRGSVDTELLLQDTQTVMAAMEARMAHSSGKSYQDSPGRESDTDVSSTVALVNGDEDYVKPTVYKSPREALSKRHMRDGVSKLATSKSSTIPTSTPTKGPPVGRSYSQTVASKSKSVASPRSVTSAASGARRSMVSDVFSRADSVDNESIVSDVSSEMGDGNLSRNGSKGKGSITMAKPNRAFQLRRARADSVDEPVTPRSGKSNSSSRTGGNSSVRSSSVHSTTRSRAATDTNRSEATSLGAQIARKGRENSAMDNKARSSTNLARADGGRHSLRLQRASSLTIAQSAPSIPATKSHPKSPGTSHYSRGGNLTVTGVSSGVSSRSQSQSQPGSRSNSPKAAERMAWKRRKEYDPRKAVAEAKAKSSAEHSGVVTRPKPSANSTFKRRMIRSASFTNSAELSLSGQNSVSGERKDNEHEGFRRAFLPFHNSLRSDRSAHSADEDDSILSAKSSQDSSRSLVTLHASHQPKSAFTPPLLHGKRTSPDTPPSLSLSLRRRTTHGEGEDLPGTSLHNGDVGETPSLGQDSPPQVSYDSLIVSSIYQLSLKLKTKADKTLNKLREQDRVSLTPSPIDDYLSDSGKSEITAWKSANQELAGVLKNLRKLDRHLQMMSRALFPEDDNNTDVSVGARTGQEKQQYYQEIERIRNEIKGFQPIEPYDQEIASPEMAALSEQF